MLRKGGVGGRGALGSVLKESHAQAEMMQVQKTVRGQASAGAGKTLAREVALGGSSGRCANEQCGSVWPAAARSTRIRRSDVLSTISRERLGEMARWLGTSS